MARTGRRSRSSRKAGWLKAKNLHPNLQPDIGIIEGCAERLGSGSKQLLSRTGIIFTTDREMARLAGIYRGERRPTDVLAFSYEGRGPLGEVFISLDAARRQAFSRGMALEHELVLLIVHGLLHLAGRDDENLRGWRRMKKAEFEVMMRIL